MNISLCDALGVSGCNRVIFSQVNINLPPLYRNVFRRDQRRFEFVTMVFPARLPAPTDGGVIRFIFYAEWKKGKTSFLRVFELSRNKGQARKYNKKKENSYTINLFLMNAL